MTYHSQTRDVITIKPDHRDRKQLRKQQRSIRRINRKG
jgi:hypothetical protein